MQCALPSEQFWCHADTDIAIHKFRIAFLGGPGIWRREQQSVGHPRTGRQKHLLRLMDA